MIRAKLLTILVFVFYACSAGKDERPVTAMDTGRDFIRASLNGDFKEAQALVLNDTHNRQLFESYKQFYNRLSAEKKQNYRSASYEINKYLELNDSTIIINYSNTYMKKPMDIKVVKVNKEWWIDFKYTYSGNLPID
jgi:hypothetical protein